MSVRGLLNVFWVDHGQCRYESRWVILSYMYKVYLVQPKRVYSICLDEIFLAKFILFRLTAFSTLLNLREKTEFSSMLI